MTNIKIYSVSDKYVTYLKYTNSKAIRLKKTNAVLKVEQKEKIKASSVLIQKGMKKLGKSHGTEFRYVSSNPSVASVTPKGIIRGIGKGTCKIYVYARNGFAKTVKVTVK